MYIYLKKNLHKYKLDTNKSYWLSVKKLDKYYGSAT